jgi:hypothetical protein
MITLQLENRHIYFALEAIWTELDYRFKYQINQLVAENDEDDFLQTIQVDRTTLNQILFSVNNKSQGVAREINPEMFLAILPQVQALAAGGNQEAIDILTDMQAATATNDTLKNATIQNGKTQILG